jgi:hypothetical protein
MSSLGPKPEGPGQVRSITTGLPGNGRGAWYVFSTIWDPAKNHNSKPATVTENVEFRSFPERF